MILKYDSVYMNHDRDPDPDLQDSDMRCWVNVCTCYGLWKCNYLLEFVLRSFNWPISYFFGLKARNFPNVLPMGNPNCFFNKFWMTLWYIYQHWKQRSDSFFLFSLKIMFLLTELAAYETTRSFPSTHWIQLKIYIYMRLTSTSTYRSNSSSNTKTHTYTHTQCGIHTDRQNQMIVPRIQ